MSRSRRPADFPFVLPAGAVVKTINRDVLTVARLDSRPALLPPGTRIVEFTVHERPVPWKVSIRRKGHGPPTNPKFAAWQRTVARAAVVAMTDPVMGRRPPYEGPFEFHALFRLIRRGPMPDLGNLSKGCLDALQGIIIGNDRDCRAEVVRMEPDSDRNEAWIEVVAV